MSKLVFFDGRLSRRDSRILQTLWLIGKGNHFLFVRYVSMNEVKTLI